jgi:tRNA pseudouridine55 synthase
MSGAAPPPHGVLVVDKPPGMSSHDVVAKLRRLLGTRRVGHAGTLDPMATGVLVMLVGEATKLGPYLTAHDKSYRARVAFGRSTDTLDAEGATIASADVPAWLAEDLARPRGGSRVEAAIVTERARREQVPPAYSAIQVEGERSYDRARAGESVELAARPVEVRALTIAASSGPPDAFLDLEVHVSKGYYVRSLARDLGEALGVPAHLAALRRRASGPYTLAGAASLEAGPDALARAIRPLAEAAAEALPRAVLAPRGVERARHGKPLGLDDFVEPPPLGPSSAWLDVDGRLVAIGTRCIRERESATKKGVGEEITVQRGFVA